MAIVKNPLLSLKAQAKFGGNIIFSNWNGMPTAKKKTDPKNPRTPGQTATRELYQEGEALWETLEYTDTDKVSLTRMISIFKKKLNAWQVFMWMFLWARKYYAVVSFAHKGESSSTIKGKLDLSCELSPGNTLFVGLTTKLNFNFQYYPLPESGTPGIYNTSIINLTPGMKYFWVIQVEIQPYIPPWIEKVIDWEDDFNDGTFTGWTIVAGVWTAVPLYLKGTTDAGNIGTDLNVVPAGEKYWYYRHKHEGTGAGANASSFQVIYIDLANRIQGLMVVNTAVDNFYGLYIVNGGVGAYLFQSTKYNYFNDAGAWFNIIIYKSGLVGKFKIWKDGDAEPAGWDWEGNFPGGMIDEGKIKAYSDAVDANGCGFDKIEIYHYVNHPAVPERKEIASGIYSQKIKT